jgi:hypothetical protein
VQPSWEDLRRRRRDLEQAATGVTRSGRRIATARRGGPATNGVPQTSLPRRA